ncbi:hypothetical protein KC341_g86 [Hortaea werneckii]|nr:hypothetical protein KC341_g86 [Hortaea werneckii]
MNLCVSSSLSRSAPYIHGSQAIVTSSATVLALLWACAGYLRVCIETDDAFMDYAFAGSAPDYLYASRNEWPKGDRNQA